LDTEQEKKTPFAKSLSLNGVMQLNFTIEAVPEMPLRVRHH
jgi:hypothetical protein